MRNLVSAMFAACALSVTVGLHAQSVPPAQGEQPGLQIERPVPPSQQPAPDREQPAPASRQQAQAQQKVTISGCIENAPAPAAGAAAGCLLYTSDVADE